MSESNGNHLNTNFTRAGSKRISANGHARRIFSPSSSNSESPGRCSISSDEMVNSSGPTTLEDEYDVTQKFDCLQQEIEALKQNQDLNTDLYNRVKKENSTLLSKVHMLEEQLRDIEIQAEERRMDEEKRMKDNMNRSLRDKSYEIDHYMNRVYTLQQELLETKDELRKYQGINERMKTERSELESVINGQADEIDSLKEEVSELKNAIQKSRCDEITNGKVIEVLNYEIEEMKNRNHGHPRSDSLISSTSHVTSIASRSNSLADTKEIRIYELETMVHQLREENKCLKESNEELQALLLNNSIEEGRSLLKEGERTMTSLADELVSLNEEQTKKALKEQQDVNAKLRAYIDGILLNIVENYPQLLEVRSNHCDSASSK